MSEIRVTSIVGENGGDRVGLTTGLTVGPLTGTTGIGATITHQGHAQFAGVCTATSFTGNGANLTNVNPYQFSSWYVSSDYTPTAADVTIKNWAESNADGYERLGTAPTYNNGVFTMPSTGYWRVQASITYYHTSANGDTFAFALRHSTDSGSNYNHFATIGGRFGSSGDGQASQQKYNWVVAGTFKVANASNSRLIVYGVDVRTDVGRIMGGTQSGADSGYCTSMHIEKMANL